jgi:YVTN family beta-propeller protein
MQINAWSSNCRHLPEYSTCISTQELKAAIKDCFLAGGTASRRRMMGMYREIDRRELMSIRSLSVVIVLLLIALPSLLVAEQYKVKSRLHLQGDSGWDYLTVDPESRELYVTHGTELQIVNLDSQEPIAKVAGMKRIHGVAIVKDLNRGFISDGGDNAVVIFDLKSHSILNKVPTGENPDAILHDAFSKRIFVFNGGSHDVTVIEAASAAVAGTIPVSGRPEFAVSDGKGNIYVNIENRSELLQLDAQALKVKKTWRLAPCEEPSGLAFDGQSRRLFSVCSNRQMAVVDADSGKVVATVPIGNGPDAVVYDPDNKLVFSSNGSDGTLTVVKQESADKYTVMETVTTAKSARTMTLDPKTHKIYLSSAELGTTPPATSDNPHPRPPIVPGSFDVLVVSAQ